MQFEFSKWDGSENFNPQSADEIFDQLSEYFVEHGDDILPAVEKWAEENPDVMDKLIKRGLIEKDREGKFRITPKGLKRVENKALEQLFNIQNRDKLGRHETEFKGSGQTVLDESKPYQFGDPVSNLNMHETLKNALVRQGGGSPIHVAEDDLVIYDTEYQTSCATVVLLDMSGSMARYGKYAAAKRVAMAMQGLVRSKYQNDFLQMVGFYTYASPMTEKELLMSAPKQVSLYDSHVHLRVNLDRPPSFVPEHFTNIHAGLQFARRILRRQAAANRQIILITDGEPTAHLEGRDIMLIYPPAEKTSKITLAEAQRCAKEGIQISSFALIEDYFYYGLVNFVEQMAQVTKGISATCNAEDMGNMVVKSFINGRRKKSRI